MYATPGSVVHAVYPGPLPVQAKHRPRSQLLCIKLSHMDILKDIAEAEACLSAEVRNVAVADYLAPLRCLTLAEHGQQRQDLLTWLTLGSDDEHQKAAWKIACSAETERLQAVLHGWLQHHEAGLAESARSVLQHVMPQLYRKFLDASIQHVGAHHEQKVHKLEQQLAELHVQLDKAHESDSASATADEVLLEQLELSERQNKKLTVECASAQRALADASKKHNSKQEQLTQQVEQLQLACANQEARNQELEAECTSLCRQLDDLQAQNVKLTEQCSAAAAAEAAAGPPQSSTQPAGSASQTNSPGRACAPIRTRRQHQAGSAGVSPRSPATDELLPECSDVYQSPNRHDAPAEPSLPSSPAKRAATKPPSPTEAAQASPLKRRAHSFGIGERPAPVQVQQNAHLRVPRNLEDTARSRAGQSSHSTPRDVHLADMPLSQQPRISRSGKLRTYSVSPPGRFRAARQVGTSDACVGCETLTLCDAGVQCALAPSLEVPQAVVPPGAALVNM